MLLEFVLKLNCSVPDERESVQKKTFTKWVNSHLVRVSTRIGDLYVDLRDGKQLIKLLEILSGERLVSVIDIHVDVRMLSHHQETYMLWVPVVFS